jgi:chromosomal replication initiator protein
MTSINEIITATAQHYGLTPDDLRGPETSFNFARPRQVAMWIACEHFNFAYSEMGRALGRDHSTILHGIRAIMKRQSPDEQRNIQIITENALGGVFRSKRNVPMFIRSVDKRPAFAA